MAESVTIARPYAEALFPLAAKESGNLAKWSESGMPRLDRWLPIPMSLLPSAIPTWQPRNWSTSSGLPAVRR
jgi:hypothetical protein